MIDLSCYQDVNGDGTIDTSLLGPDIVLAHAKDLSRDGDAGHEAAEGPHDEKDEHAPAAPAPAPAPAAK